MSTNCLCKSWSTFLHSFFFLQFHWFSYSTLALSCLQFPMVISSNLIGYVAVWPHDVLHTKPVWVWQLLEDDVARMGAKNDIKATVARRNEQRGWSDLLKRWTFAQLKGRGGGGSSNESQIFDTGCPELGPETYFYSGSRKKSTCLFHSNLHALS